MYRNAFYTHLHHPWLWKSATHSPLHDSADRHCRVAQAGLGSYGAEVHMAAWTAKAYSSSADWSDSSHPLAPDARAPLPTAHCPGLISAIPQTPS